MAFKMLQNSKETWTKHKGAWMDKNKMDYIWGNLKNVSLTLFKFI